MAECLKLAVIGDPIAHSLSPLLHSAMAQELGIPVSYTAQRVCVDALPDWICRVRQEGYAGFNATMPHKLHLIPLMDYITEQGRYFGAVNTVRSDNGVLTGHNTDGDGFAEMLREHGLSFCNASVTILGAGGAAGAITRKAVQDGARCVTVMNRTPAHAERLRAAFPEILQVCSLEQPVPPDTDLLINTIPAGNSFQAAFVQAVSRQCAVFDILYAPPKTPLLEAAEARGQLAVNGLGMLIHQAILAFVFFTGAAVDQREMANFLYQLVRENS